MRKISAAITNNIVSLLQQGNSVESTARTTSVSVGHVSKVRRSIEDTIDKENVPLNGRPSKLSEVDDRQIRRVVRSGAAKSASKVVKLLKATGAVNVSAATVRRSLKRSGMKSIKPKKKPRLTKRHTKARP